MKGNWRNDHQFAESSHLGDPLWQEFQVAKHSEMQISPNHCTQGLLLGSQGDSQLSMLAVFRYLALSCVMQGAQAPHMTKRAS